MIIEGLFPTRRFLTPGRDGFIVLRRLMPEVSVVQFGVVAALLHERVVVALLDDAPLLQHNNAVSGAHGGEAVGDEDCRAVGHDQVAFWFIFRRKEGLGN